MEDNNSVTFVSYNKLAGIPTIVDGVIQEDCVVRISLMGDAMIIDKDFIDEITSIVNNSEIPNDLMGLLGFVQKTIKEYFYSSNGYDKTRPNFYNEYSEVDEEGAVIGTKISRTKGQNIALCSEKAVTAYIILDKLFREGKITRKPSLVLSSLAIGEQKPGPHAFIIIDGNGEYPRKHILYDPENQAMLEDVNGNRGYNLGLYCLTDEQRENITNGIECSPETLYSAFNMPYSVVSDKLTYGHLKSTEPKM